MLTKIADVAFTGLCTIIYVITVYLSLIIVLRLLS